MSNLPEYDIRLAEKLEELARLARAGKVLYAQERITYDPMDYVDFLPRDYEIKFVVRDTDTSLPVTVTIMTPVEKKNG